MTSDKRETTPMTESNDTQTDATVTQDPAPQADPECGAGRGKRRRRFFVFSAFAALGALLIAIPAALAGPFGARGGPGCGHHRGSHAKTPEQVREHMDFGADKVLSRIDGTDAQRAEVGALLDKLAPEVFALKTEADTLKDAFHAAIASGQELDPAELERLRVEGLKLADKASKRALDALLDFQEVLTPEQRAELIGDLQRLQRWQR